MKVTKVLMTGIIASLFAGQSFAQSEIDMKDFGLDQVDGKYVPQKFEFEATQGANGEVRRAKLAPVEVAQASDAGQESVPSEPVPAQKPVKEKKKPKVVLSSDSGGAEARVITDVPMTAPMPGQKGYEESVNRIQSSDKTPAMPFIAPDRTPDGFKTIDPEFPTIEEAMREAPPLVDARTTETVGSFNNDGTVTVTRKDSIGPQMEVSSESVINTTQGVTEIVQIGRSQLNRFVVPFENVSVVTASDATIETKGRIVYITTNDETPFGVFITEKGTDRAISLTLVPSEIPQRDIYLAYLRPKGLPPVMRMPDAQGSEMSSGVAVGDHIAMIKDVMRGLARSEVPAGYTLVNFVGDEFTCNMPGLVLKLGQMMEGPSQKIAVMLVENRSGKTQKIDEQWCYRKGVLAISPYPYTTLEHGERTEMYVLMKDVQPEMTSNSRPSLLGR